MFCSCSLCCYFCAFLCLTNSATFIRIKLKIIFNSSKMTDQIEMSTAENIIGSVSNVLNRHNSLRPTFSFNIGIVGQTPNSSWTPFNLMMAPIQKRANTFVNKMA